MSQTIDYLRAQLHRAQNQGDKTVSIATLDLQELIQISQSIIDKANKEVMGQHAGWCRSAHLREMCSGKRFRMTVRRQKTDEFDTSLGFKSLPPRLEGEPDGTETSVLPAQAVCEPSVS